MVLLPDADMQPLRTLRLASVVVAVLTLAACKGGIGPGSAPEIPHPLSGATKRLCCNLYYEKTKITDVAWQVGHRIPFGTRVRIERVRKDVVEFTPEGHPTITLVFRYGDAAIPFDAYLDRLFVDNDPRGRLRKVSAKRVDAIENGLVDNGMTKDQVLMARGMPPAHRTPSLESPTWMYWQNRHDTMVVYFVNDRVERIAR
jgi:hypothetical protein